MTNRLGEGRGRGRCRRGRGGLCVVASAAAAAGRARFKIQDASERLGHRTAAAAAMAMAWGGAAFLAVKIISNKTVQKYAVQKEGYLRHKADISL